MLAHQGEELLIPLLITSLVLIAPMIRRRARRSGHPAADRDPRMCAYCGAAITDQDQNCSACGFRVRR